MQKDLQKMEKNNKNNQKKNCIIAANVVLLITISLFIYKAYLIKSYSISKYEDRYNKFCNLYENREEKESCQEIQKGDKQSKISKEDLDTILKIIDSNQ